MVSEFSQRVSEFSRSVSECSLSVLCVFSECEQSVNRVCSEFIDYIAHVVVIRSEYCDAGVGLSENFKKLRCLRTCPSTP